MNCNFSYRLDHFKTGVFTALTEKKTRLEAEGRKLYNLFVGTPDFKPEQSIIDALSEAAKDPDNYKYSLRDLPQMLDAVVDYYKERYGVDISPDEITSVNGSQEGMCHIGMTLCNRGDVVLLPDPGYPAFEAGAFFGDANIVYYPIIKENDFLLKIEDIDEEILKKTKYIVVSYPSNPVGAVAPKEMYVKLIEYAKKYDFIIINDNAYSDIIFDGKEGFSFLSLNGAKDVGFEFFSLSKSFNVTGARISYAVGNKKVIDSLKVIRSQYDFGMFIPTQYAAIAAMKIDPSIISKQCDAYQRRRDALCGGLRSIGWDVPDSQGTMFVWAPIPPNYTCSAKFCDDLVEMAGVLCTPGISFGNNGEGYVRFALILPEDELKNVVKAIDESGILRG
ncbi:MAG: aminotransferase class I/II-fold pyridoxal phosphate-dependent enzyme [Eubacteriales bacterium]|nr:aminotransferase class I/II-fold pyridoxal phosphate-dependent enzyme [Eubacteriales bacterium]